MANQKNDLARMGFGVKFLKSADFAADVTRKNRDAKRCENAEKVKIKQKNFEYAEGYSWMCILEEKLLKKSEDSGFKNVAAYLRLNKYAV